MSQLKHKNQRGNAASLCGWYNCKLRRKEKWKRPRASRIWIVVVVVGWPVLPHLDPQLVAECQLVPKAVKPPQALVDHGRRRDSSPKTK